MCQESAGKPTTRKAGWIRVETCPTDFPSDVTYIYCWNLHSCTEHVARAHQTNILKVTLVTCYRNLFWIFRQLFLRTRNLNLSRKVFVIFWIFVLNIRYVRECRFALNRFLMKIELAVQSQRPAMYLWQIASTPVHPVYLILTRKVVPGYSSECQNVHVHVYLILTRKVATGSHSWCLVSLSLVSVNAPASSAPLMVDFFCLGFGVDLHFARAC